MAILKKTPNLERASLYKKLYVVPFTILQYGVPYGPRMRTELVIPTFLKKAFNGQPITIAGNGSQYRIYLY